MMAIAKSPRAKHEDELVNWDLFEELSHVQVAIDINSENIFEHLQLDLQCRTNTRKNLDSQDSSASSIKKNIKRELPKLGDNSKKNKSKAMTSLLSEISRKENNKTIETGK